MSIVSNLYELRDALDSISLVVDELHDEGTLEEDQRERIASLLRGTDEYLDGIDNDQESQDRYIADKEYELEEAKDDLHEALRGAAEAVEVARCAKELVRSIKSGKVLDTDRLVDALRSWDETPAGREANGGRYDLSYV